MAVALILAVLAAAGFAAWSSTTLVVYFDPALATQPSGCRWGGREEPQLDEFEADWFGGQLREFGEPSLYLAADEPGSGSPSIIRFLWLRSFHDPIVVRVDTDQNGRAVLTAKQRPHGAGFYGGQARNLTRALTPSEAAQLSQILAENRVLQQQPKICEGGLDGARWIVEATDGPNGYTLINRFSSNEPGPIHRLGLFMLGLTGWDVGEVY